MLKKIAGGRTDLVMDFVGEGHSSTFADQHGTKLIQWCAYHGDVSAIRFLLQNGEKLASLGPNYDLSGAAFHGHWKLCQFLIDCGAEVDYQHPDTAETALHASLCKANRPIYDHVVEVLVSGGANPNLPTRPNAATGSFMRDCRTKAETPLHRAAAFGTERSINILLNAGADRSAKDMHGDSPLSWASWHLRPAPILRSLCYDRFSIRQENESTYDHGAGWSQIDPPMLGRPQTS